MTMIHNAFLRLQGVSWLRLGGVGEPKHKSTSDWRHKKRTNTTKEWEPKVYLIETYNMKIRQGE